MTVQDSLEGAGVYRLRIEDFLLLDRSGAFDRHAKTELLGGEVLFMNAQHRPHARAKIAMFDAIRDALGRASPLTVMVEASVALTDHDAPEPDLVLTTEPEGEGLIPGASVRLVVEVSDATIAADLGRKRAIYAAAAIPEYWVVDVQGRTIHQMWSPAGEVYRDRSEIAFGAPVAARTIAGLTIATKGL